MPASDTFTLRARVLIRATAITCLGLAGCGAVPGTNAVLGLVADECPGASLEKTTATDAILLEWDGGTSRIYPGEALPRLDLRAFLVSDGATLAEEAEDFKAAVRDEVSRILCEMPIEGIHLTNTKAGLPREITTVYFAQMQSPLGGVQIGQGEYDPCNENHDDHAIIFGDQILTLGDARSFDEWVLMFANVTAHEIGHMLGYGHVPRVIYPASQRPDLVELMMASHTSEEMVQPQRLLADTSNCPDGHDPTASHGRAVTLQCSPD